jgi:hypothetical protein
MSATTPPPKHIREKILAGKLLISAAGHISAELAKFSGWLIAGFAVALGAFVANLEAAVRIVEPKILGTAIVMFLGAVVIHVMQRWLAAITAGSMAASKEGEVAGTTAAGQGELDPNALFSEVERSVYLPARWLVRGMFQKALNGDFAISGRIQFKSAQLQALSVLVQLSLSVGAVCVIAFNLKL